MGSISFITSKLIKNSEKHILVTESGKKWNFFLGLVRRFASLRPFLVVLTFSHNIGANGPQFF